MNITEQSPEDLRLISKRCATCKIISLSLYSTYVNCEQCRDKNRRKQELAKKRKMERDAHIRLLLADSDDEPTSENRRVSAVSGPSGMGPPIITSSGGIKSKLSKGLRDLEGEEQRLALGVMKNGLKQTVEGNKRVVTPTRVISTTGEGKEYQTASAIYDALKRRVTKATSQVDTGKRLQFNGFHAIIAINSIDNEKRVSMVANDLRKIARIPFDHTNPSSSYNFETTGRTLEYRCTCLGHDTVPSTAPVAIPKTTMKGTHGDLIRQARQRASLEGSLMTIPRLCGGKVRITAVDDGRHPLGILAQRISICIEHPGVGTKTKAV